MFCIHTYTSRPVVISKGSPLSFAHGSLEPWFRDFFKQHILPSCTLNCIQTCSLHMPWLPLCTFDTVLGFHFSAYLHIIKTSTFFKHPFQHSFFSKALLSVPPTTRYLFLPIWIPSALWEKGPWPFICCRKTPMTFGVRQIWVKTGYNSDSASHQTNCLTSFQT